MGSLIDTGVLIAIERGQITLHAALAGFTSEPVAISAITAAELLQGVERASEPHRATRHAAVEDMLSRFPVAPFDLPVARSYARLMAARSKIGQPIAPHDLIIAATALTIGYRIITRDMKSFPTISGLEVVRR